MDIDRIEPISRDTDAADVATRVLDDLIAFLGTLAPGDWQRVTECAPWTVADTVGHIIGAARGCASPLEGMRQQAWGFLHKRDYDSNPLDAVNDRQVRDHVELTPAQRIAALVDVAPRSVAGRMRFPGVLRGLSVPIASSGSTAGMPSRLGLGKTMDVIYTRDQWLHRVDIARATGRELPLSRVDARVVEDVVLDWAAQHGRPVDLQLTGPAGGSFTRGTGGEHVTMDAVEFCRALSGRTTAAPFDTLVVF